MKKLLFSSFIGLALVTFTGCTSSCDATPKSSSEKCDSATKCSAQTKSASSGKCSK